MKNYLIEDALTRVWCTPDQDRQAILKPVRLTPEAGSWGYVDVLWDQIALPETNVRYHVYMIGQLHPRLLGLFPSYRKWKRVSENCTEQSMICNLYLESGLEFPRFQAWYMVTENKNLLFAIRQPQSGSLVVDFTKPEVFIRVYSNEYFKSNRRPASPTLVTITGKYIGNISDIVTLQTQFEALKLQVGHVFGIVNGYKVDSITPLNTKVGDIAELEYDSSIKAIYDFPILNLPTFVSTLDATRKYLLHYPGNTETIDFEDDIDLFLIKPGANSTHKGIYHHKNNEFSLRNLTHKDYSVSVDLINTFMSYQSAWTNLNDLTVRIHIRESGYLRSLVYEASRIHELYKLPEADLTRALLGIDSTLAEFRAPALEASQYPAVMRSYQKQITNSMVESMYGYNAISRILCDTPKKTYLASTTLVADVGYGLVPSCTGFEYDADGLLLGYKDHSNATTYLVQDPACVQVEFITGTSSLFIDDTYNARTQTLDPTRIYRFYKCQIVNSHPDFKWVEIDPDTTGEFAIINNTLTWLNDASINYTLVRSDSVNLVYDIALPLSRGLLKFTLNSGYMDTTGPKTKVMDLEMGRLDLFMNGHLLIEDLDYIVQFPQIVVTNKEYLVNPLTDAQAMTVRFMGHCTSDLTREKGWDTGFINHGLLSANNRFDIRDDKVLHISVDGALYDRSELQFAETDSSVSATDVRNGVPYQIREIIPRISQFTEAHQKELRAQSMDIDSRVADYMSLKLPEATFSDPNVIEDYYRIYSPFFSAVMSDLLAGIINDPRILGDYSLVDVREILAGYEYLLDYDPTTPEHIPDLNYVIIDPYYGVNIVDVNIYQYRFLTRTIECYLNDRIVMNHALRLVQYGT